MDAPKHYRNKETGEVFAYLEMLEEWRARYEGADAETGLWRYNWHSRYDYIGPKKEGGGENERRCVLGAQA